MNNIFLLLLLMNICSISLFFVLKYYGIIINEYRFWYYYGKNS